MRGWLLIASVAAALAGCANVAPYQRGHLAKPEMQFDRDHAETKLTQHTWHSKEASTGGYGTGAGGCGCN